MTPTARYDPTAIVLHWLLGAMILASLAGGLFMTGLALTPTRLKLFNWHKWAGMMILALSAVRLLWRLSHAPPPDLPGPGWQRHAARATHRAMYLLFFAVPLAGWAYSSAAGFPVVVFGVLALPDFVPVDRELAGALKLLHHALAYTLGALAALHVAAALKHQLVDGDGLLRRMWPARG
jgi:cytochrome b561